MKQIIIINNKKKKQFDVEKIIVFLKLFDFPAGQQPLERHRQVTLRHTKHLGWQIHRMWHNRRTCTPPKIVHLLTGV